MNVVFGVYYNDGKDLQRNVIIDPNNYEYIKNWSESAKNLNMKCILLTDGSCSEDFINQYSNNNLEIKKVTKKYKGCLNDIKFLDIMDCLCDKYENIFITDVSDVHFLKNPFDLIKENKLYIGCEQKNNREIYKCKEIAWARATYGAKMPTFPFWDENFLNCGIIGGSSKVINLFLNNYKKIFYSREWPANFPNDMIISTLVAYTYFKDQIVTGFPLHTIFKKYENNHPEAYIVHK